MNANREQGREGAMNIARLAGRCAMAVIAAGFALGSLAATPVENASAFAAPSATQPEAVERQTAPMPNKKLRFRLDDGRYQGFHQDDPEKLRSDDRVIAENDRIRQERRAAQQRSEGAVYP
jgi:hypothetical protein